MDMFVYGCSRVLRYFSLLNHTFVMYDTKKILDELGLTQQEFREICVLSGTDYNVHCHIETESMNLYKALRLFKKYHKTEKNINFYTWLKENDSNNLDYDLLTNVYKMFDLPYHSYETELNSLKIVNGWIDREKLQSILKMDGFIFPN